MLEEIDAHDTKTKPPEILRRVEAGESLTITNRGKPVADLIPSRITTRLKNTVCYQQPAESEKTGGFP